MSSVNKDYNKHLLQSCLRHAEDLYTLELLGEHLSVQYEYLDTTGIEGVYIYLANKYHWTISQCRSMTPEDLLLALRAETAELAIGPDERFATLATEILAGV